MKFLKCILIVTTVLNLSIFFCSCKSNISNNNNSVKITVIGYVKNPGIHNVDPANLTVSEIIELAGGVDANKWQAVISSGETEIKKLYPKDCDITLLSIINNYKNNEITIDIRSGDLMPPDLQK
jgi:protein involved in polysaccharide export with SLBB domain